MQSTACLVLAAQGKIDFPTFIFANVGKKAENRKTIEYVEQYSKPFAEKHGIEFVTVAKMNRFGIPRDLFDDLMDLATKTIHIPVFMPKGGLGYRKCTVDYKIKPVRRFIKKRGATAKKPAIVGIGISLDEFHRMRDSLDAFAVNNYPLVDMRIRRQECVDIIKEAGLPVPPKSSCWFCPYQKLKEWEKMATEDPVQFALGVELERTLWLKNDGHINGNVLLTRKGVPLDQAVLPSGQLPIFVTGTDGSLIMLGGGIEEEDEECTGYCMT